jgi:deazaflavin-dependent oxidoreductase (nitroreductase family)
MGTMSDFNTQVIEEFRANKGIVGGHFEGKRLLILHTVGRRTGQPRLNPLVYTTNGTTLLVAGSNGGAEKEPVWVANVEAMPEATIEIGEETKTVKVSVIRDGEQWDEDYAKLVEYWPDFRKYEENTDRKFAVIRLDPVG